MLLATGATGMAEPPFPMSSREDIAAGAATTGDTSPLVLTALTGVGDPRTAGRRLDRVRPTVPRVLAAVRGRSIGGRALTSAQPSKLTEGNAGYWAVRAHQHRPVAPHVALVDGRTRRDPPPREASASWGPAAERRPYTRQETQERLVQYPVLSVLDISQQTVTRPAATAAD